ncbi:serine/threonine-protein kinase atr [Microplitis demolitor]|uniref:serine/threonine-protein kinase atr n=1 Tax=Microplitis demolitor TaxID=69319 RepID=UPI0004CCBCD1|nr:serine/threonine-protein kinase atr [Microplitis demolitor]
MEKMDVESSASSSSPENQQANDIEMYWCAVNTPIHSIFKYVKESGTEDRLLKCLESLINSSDTPMKILIPPILRPTASKDNNNTNNIYEQVELSHKKYNLFTIWIFGMLFYTSSVPTFSQKMIDSCENVQIKLLKALYWLYYRGFNLIYTRYIEVLDYLLPYIDDDNESGHYDSNLNLTISKFKVDQSFSSELNLTIPTMTIDSRDRVLSVMISVLKILVNSEIFDDYTDHKKNIWHRTIAILKKLDPRAKVLAVKLMSKIIEFTDNDEQIKIFLIYVQEIFESANNWQSCTWNKEAIDDLNTVIAKILDNIAINRKEIFNFCLNIISTCEHKQLQLTACKKIINYLKEYPTSLENNKFLDETHQGLLAAFKRFDNDEICRVIAHIIAADIFIFIRNYKHKSDSKIFLVAKSSFLWEKLLDFVDSQEKSEHIKYICRLIKISRLLSSWLQENTDMHGKFFPDYHRLCQTLSCHLETAAESKNLNEIQMIYCCFMDLMSFIEPSNQITTLLFHIILLPLTLSSSAASAKQDLQELSFKNNDLIISVSKTVDTSTKISCINTLCQFYRGKDHISYLSGLITATATSNSNEQADQLATAVILNSPLLILNSSNIRFSHINMHILNPAYVGKKRVLLEALGKIIGPIVCILSGRAKIIPHTWDSLEWKVRCDVCDSKNYFYSSDNLIKKEDEIVLRAYLNLLKFDSVIRINIADNLIKLSNHTRTFNTNEVTSLWLPWLRDSNESVRVKLSRSVEIIIKNRLAANLPDYKNICQEDWPQDLRLFIKSIIKELVGTLDAVLDEKLNESVHETLLITTKYIARVPIYFIEKRLYSIFIISIIHPNSSYIGISTASVSYKETAGYYNLTPKEIFSRHKTELLVVIVRLIARNSYVKSHNLSLTLNRLSNCFGFIGSREIFRKNGSVIMSILIPLVVKVQPRINNILKEITFLMSSNESDIYSEYFSHIFPYIYLNEELDVVNKCLKLIVTKTKKTLAKLIDNNFSEIFRELLLHFHDKQSRVIYCLDAMIQYSDDRLNGMTFENKENVAEYLNSRLLAILVFFDGNLNPDKSDFYTQRCALGSLSALIKFMGVNYINQLKHKILAILRAALRNFSKQPDLRRLACEAWDSFINNIALNELGPLLPTICISLIPLLEVYPDDVNKMLEYILIKNYRSVSQDIQELFFFNDLPNIKVEITEKIKSQISRTPDDFVKNLQVWQRRIVHETDEVRLKALIHLKNFLQQHRSELNEMILNHDATNHVHPAIISLLDALLAGCRQQDTATENNQHHLRQDIRHWSGECLGELGAIEPNLLPRRIISRGDSKFMSEMNEEFACDLLNELVRAFNEQNTTRNVDCFSLAIQEILKVWDIKPEGGANSELWRSFTPLTQQIVFPMLTSHYTILSTPDASNINYPIYGTEAARTFESWICNWVCRMIASLKFDRNNPDNNYEKIITMLNACWPAFKRDLETTMFCIPQLVTLTIISGNDSECDGLVREILAVISVISDQVDNDEYKRQQLRPMKSLFDDIKYLNSNNSNSNDSKSESNDPERLSSNETRRIRCSQVIFSTLDHLRRWLQETKRADKKTLEYKAVKKFIDRLNNLQLAEGCYESREYHRALMYLERHMKDNKNNELSSSSEIDLLAKIYTQLEEPDGVFGILASQDRSPTIEQLVLAHEVGGQMQDAATCYERLAQHHNSAPKYIKGIIKCYLSLEQPFTAINITSGILNSKPELEPHLIDSEPFWRLAHFVHLNSNDDNVTNKRSNELDSNDDEKTYVKRTLMMDLSKGKQPNLSALKRRLISMIGFASSHQDAYQQSYSHIMKLHVINEFEKAMQLMIKDIDALPNIFDEWEKRSSLVRASRGVEFVMGMRRAALDLALTLSNTNNKPSTAVSSDNKLMSRLNERNKSLKEEIGKIWLKSAKIARKAGLYQQAYMYILSASDCPPQELHIEEAQLYWQKDCQEDAFNTLKRSFKQCYESPEYYRKIPISGPSAAKFAGVRKNLAKAKLLFAQYNDQIVNVSTEINKIYYQEAVEVWQCWEKSYLACAQYHDSLFERMTEEQRLSDSGLLLQLRMVNSYGKSLKFGCKYIHQAMPRMLTIWMNLASCVHGNRNATNEQIERLKRMTKIMDLYADGLPNFMWLTALSQLISRICHPETTIRTVLNKILANLIVAYPHYCLWVMASVINSSYDARKKRCQEIFEDPKLQTGEMKKYLTDFRRLWECIMEVSNRDVPGRVFKTSIKELSKSLVFLLASPDFGPIPMPTSLFFQLRLPSSSIGQSKKNTNNVGYDIKNYNPFPQNNDTVYIKSIEDEIDVINSLARPRKITLIGSDGKRYLFMCKPKDDLRKDFRLMEFNSIVNKYLQKDPESRQRRLYIRMYSVIPIDEECGLVEWIPNLTGFRPIIKKLYEERGLQMMQGKKLADTARAKYVKNDSLEKKRDTYLKALLPEHPAVFGDWFRLNFPDAYGWYEARNAYIRTTAVMSIVGYILGLGDRHGENILFDSKCGDCVHVDFNCLFNRGETFEVPERVPFRLTHNMVDAMGPLKYEGPFRRSCQITMRILRQQTSTLMSILTPFVYDPLVAWSKSMGPARNGTSNITAERTNERAVKNIKDIELRLKGFVKVQDRELETAGVSLSVEGQTNHVILDATNIDNLCRMYVGWSAFI